MAFLRGVLFLWVLGLYLALGCLSGPARAATQASTLTPVTLQLKWLHQFQFAGYYAAVEKGYYREAGFEVTLKEAGMGIDTVQEVVSGRAAFGVGTSELMISYALGEPVLMLAPIFQHSPLVMLVRADAQIDSIHDLPGKQVMIEPQSAQLLAYFLSEGIALNTLQYNDHNFEIGDLLSGRIDGLSAYITDEPFLMNQQKIPYRMFTPRTNGMDFYGDTLFTSQQYYSRFPEQVKAFREASLKGWQYALSHPEEMIHLIRDKYSTRKSEAHLRYEAKHTFDMVSPDFVEVGYSKAGRWQRIQEVYQKYGLMPENVPLNDFFYTEENQLKLPNWAYFLLVFLGFLAGALGFIAILILYFNHKLRLEIREREAVEQALILSRNELEQANMAKRNFLAHMSHEIRTPMNGVVSMLALLKGSTLPDHEKKYIDIAKTSTNLLLGLVGDILDFSRIEAGKLELENAPFSVSEMVREVVRVMAIQAHEKGLQFHVSSHLLQPDEVLGDKMRLQQILFNLLGNAIKFTRQGYVKVDLRATQTEQDRIALLFQVIDTGVGIDEANITKLFEPFQQQDTSINRRFGGSGLGLAIASQLIRFMGGDIWAKSRPEGGSCFAFQLPMVCHTPSHQTPEMARAEHQNLTGKKVGLFGLQGLTLQGVEEILLSHQAEVCVYEDFGEFTEALQQGELYGGVTHFQAIKPLSPVGMEGCVLLVPLGQDIDHHQIESAGFTFCAYPTMASDLLNCFRPVSDATQDVAASSGVARTQHTVLLVEDNPINQTVARAIIERLPDAPQLKIANHGEEALAILKTDYEAIDLILMDLQMPVMDGFETLKVIRNHGLWSELPVVAVTAQALSGDREHCLAVGFNAYLSKPFLPEQLQDVLAKYVR